MHSEGTHCERRSAEAVLTRAHATKMVLKNHIVWFTGPNFEVRLDIS